MADRTVSVGLKLDAQQYKSEIDAIGVKTEAVAESVDKLDREVSKIPTDAAKAGAGLAGLGVETDRVKEKTEGLGDKVKSTDDKLKDIPPDAAKVAAALALLGTEAETVGRSLDGFNDRNSRSVTSLDVLNKSIANARAEVKKFADEFNKTGDGGSLSKMFSSQNALKDLEDLKKKVISGLANAGQQGGQEFAKNLSASAQGVESNPMFGSALVVGVVTAIVASSPLIGAALGAALLGGVGLAGIGLGIIGQIQNPEVHDAFTGLLYDVEHEWQDATGEFAKPLEAAASIFKGSFDAILPELSEGLSKLALYVQPLAAGLGGMFTEMMPGFLQALDAAGPILMAISQQLPLLGRALSDMFTSISGGGHGAAEAIQSVFFLLEGGIRIVGWLIEGFSKLYEGIVVVFDKISSIGESLLGWIPGIGAMVGVIHEVFDAIRNGPDSEPMTNYAKVVGDTTVDFKGLASQIGQTAETADTLAAKMSQKMFSSLMSVDEATLHWHESLTTLSDDLSKNGLAIDKHTHLVAENTKNGEANRQAILGAVSANMAQYQAFVSAGMSAKDATAAYDANTKALERQLHQAGYTQAQIDDLIGKYREVPDTINTNIQMQGLTDAINSLDDAIRLANNLDGRVVTMTVEEQRRTGGDDPYNQRGHATGAIRYAAVGTLIPPSNPGTVIAGEPQTGGEALIPLRGISGTSAAGFAQVVGNNYGFDVVPRGMSNAAPASGGGHFSFEFKGGGSPLQTALYSALIYGIRTNQIVIKDSLGKPVSV